MNPLFISSLDDLADFIEDSTVEIDLTNLERFVNDVRDIVIQRVEEDADYALQNYLSALEIAKLRPANSETQREINSLTKAVEALQQFPGTMNLGMKEGKIAISFSNLLVARSLNFGTKDIPKLDINGRAVAILLQEAGRRDLKLQRETLIY